MHAHEKSGQIRVSKSPKKCEHKNNILLNKSADFYDLRALWIVNTGKKDSPGKVTRRDSSQWLRFLTTNLMMSL